MHDVACAPSRDRPELESGVPVGYPGGGMMMFTIASAFFEVV
jgi:hypothetical protein